MVLYAHVTGVVTIVELTQFASENPVVVVAGREPASPPGTAGSLPATTKKNVSDCITPKLKRPAC
jgi:hypothetical protein